MKLLIFFGLLLVSTSAAHRFAVGEFWHGLKTWTVELGSLLANPQHEESSPLPMLQRYHDGQWINVTETSMKSDENQESVEWLSENVEGVTLALFLFHKPGGHNQYRLQVTHMGQGVAPPPSAGEEFAYSFYPFITGKSKSSNIFFGVPFENSQGKPRLKTLDEKLAQPSSCHQGNSDVKCFMEISNEYDTDLLVGYLSIPGVILSEKASEISPGNVLRTLVPSMFNLQKRNNDGSSARTRMRSISSNATLSSIERIWSRASNLQYIISSVASYWYFYEYDDTLLPVNSITDGGFDMFDIGNQVKYYEDSNKPTSYLVYNSSMEFHTSEVITGGDGYPFMTFAWITNDAGEDHEYFIEVTSNVGADGNGNIEIYSGDITIPVEEDGKNLTATLKYHVFQVYGTSDPIICEIFFTLSFEGWDSQSGDDFEMIFSSETDMVINKVKLSGRPKNVLLSYILLSATNITLIPERDVRAVLEDVIRLVTTEMGNTGVSTACGGVYLLDGATTLMVASPGYPFFVEPGITCFYTFQAQPGYRIDITLDADLTPGYQSFVVDDIWWFQNSTFITSVGSSVNLRFASYPVLYTSFLPSGTGFIAEVRQYLPTCGFNTTIQNESLTISMPEEIGTENVDCLWIIDRSWFSNSILLINITDLELHGENDFVSVATRFYGNSYYFDSQNSPVSFILPFNSEVFIRYHGEVTMDPNEFKATLNRVECGGRFELTDTSVKTVGLDIPVSIQTSNPWNFYSYCSWEFVAQIDYKMEVTIQQELITTNVYFPNWIYVFNGLHSDNIQVWNDKVTVISSEERLLISWSGYLSTVRYNLTYRQFLPDCEFNEMVNSSDIVVSSPNYPNEQDAVVDCIWTFSAMYGQAIQISLNDVDMTQGSSYLVINGGLHTLKRIDNAESSIGDILSTSGLTLYYHSQPRSGSGFEAVIQEGNCDTLYQLTDDLIHTASILQHSYQPYSSSIGSISCLYTIQAQNGYRILFEIEADFPTYDSIYYYYGSNAYINLHEHNTTTTLSFTSYNSRRNYLLLSEASSLTFDYQYTQFKNFSLSFNRVNFNACGFTLTATTEERSFSSMMYPSSYLHDQDCYWLITAKPDHRVMLTFHDLDLQMDHSYVLISTTTEGLIHRYSSKVEGTKVYTSSVGGKILVGYKSNGATSGRGFNATFKLSDQCGEAVHLKSADTNLWYYSLVIPSYECGILLQNMSSGGQLEYYFFGEENYKIELYINSWYYGNDSDTYLEVTDADSSVGKISPGSLVANRIVSSGSSLKLTYHFDVGFLNFSTFGFPQFYISPRLVPVVATCGYVESAKVQPQTIISPGYPESYGINQDCLWIITVPDQSTLLFNVTFLDLETSDYLRIHDSDGNSLQYTDFLSSPASFTVNARTLRVVFFSGPSGVRKGFTATYVLDTDECASEPCHNGGICIDVGNSFECVCPHSYTGSQCDISVSACESAPCLNGGTCIETPSERGFNCACQTGYTGELCYPSVNECEQGNPCSEHADCFDLEVGYNCTCREGYRGNGKTCDEVILLDYGSSTGDTLLPIEDDAISPSIYFEYGIPFGSELFYNLRITSNGLIYFGSKFNYRLNSLNRPPASGFSSSDVALLAPFWDNFHPSENNNGRVYYQAYDKTRSNVASSLVEEVERRIEETYALTSFDSKFVFKATWENVVMYPEDQTGYRNFPSTFQAVLATDGCDTYVLYIYKEDAMLWRSGLRDVDIALIGYTNGKDLSYIESQGIYDPDKRMQQGGGKRGQFFYKLSNRNSPRQNARCACLNWYLDDLESSWTPDETPCPCSNFQATRDPEFVTAVDLNLWRNSEASGNYTSANVEEWLYDSVPIGQCYQLRDRPGPRCCYRRRLWFSPFWSTWWWRFFSGPITVGPFGSRYERFQIPFLGNGDTVDTRTEELFLQQYNDALNHDLIPRRQCCVESRSWKHCQLYRERRPSASCWGYDGPGGAFFFGDPHINTLDGTTYTFNGLGEYHLLYADGIFSMQARTKRVAKDDGTLSDATAFVAFAVKELRTPSGTVQFDVNEADESGTGIKVSVNGATYDDLNEVAKLLDGVTLTNINETYIAVFPNGHSVTVTASSKILSLEFAGSTNLLQNVSKGLLGYWSGNKEDDFELRNGTTLSYSDLMVTNDLDLLNGTLSEKKLYTFGQSWQIEESESIFDYSIGEGGFTDHNPSDADEPPFLEELVASLRGTEQLDKAIAVCTSDDSLSTACLFDTLTTNRTEIGQTTVNEGATFRSTSIAVANNPPVLSIDARSVDYVDGFLRATVGEVSTVKLIATDSDGDSVTFSLDSSNNVTGVTVDPDSGVVSWTPSEEHASLDPLYAELIILADDGNSGESLITIAVKLCICKNNGTCLFDDASASEGSNNFQIVGCECTEAWSGDDCSEDRNLCELSACHTGVTCTDIAAPGVGFECGDCPAGTTGDGRLCTTIDLCESNPCEYQCQSLFNNFSCVCQDGYQPSPQDMTVCVDVDECDGDNSCSTDLRDSICVNTAGSYRCECPSNWDEQGILCIARETCASLSCSQFAACWVVNGVPVCVCNSGYNGNGMVCEETTSSVINVPGQGSGAETLNMKHSSFVLMFAAMLALVLS